jgi:adenylate cyclase
MSDKKKLLVIEDLPEIQKLLSARLKASGYDVITAKDGIEGMGKAEHDNPDLIITDLALPQMTGNVLVRVLKSSEKFKHIPIIMLSAFVHEKMGLGVEFPADAYIAKPFQAEVLIDKVRELLKENSPKS